MKTKRYKSKEKPLPKVEEPVALDDKPEEFDACYAKLKAEADEKFGVKELMTVDEYFGKLWYIVNAYYDGIQNQGEGRNHH